MKTSIFILLILACVYLCWGKGVKKIMAYEKKTKSASEQSLSFYAGLFNVTVEDIEKHTKKVAQEFTEQIQELCRIKKDSLSYAHVFGALDSIQSFSDGARWYNVCSALEMVSPDQAVRAAAHTALEKMGNMFVDMLSNNRDLYFLCKEYVQNNLAHEHLLPEQKFFVDHTMQQFKRAGLELDDELFLQVAVVKKELVRLGLEFDAAIAQDSTVVGASFEDLDGLHQDIIDQFAKGQDGLYQLRLDYPTYAHIMSKCTNAQLRKRFYTAFNNRAYPVNHKTLHAIIQKRHELATLLGYKTFAEFDLGDQMVGSVESATLFLDDLIARCKPKVEQEFTELKKIVHPSVQWTDNNKIQPWDLEFIQTMYKNTYYDLDPNMIAEYFPLEKTVDALLSIYSDFLGITFKQVDYKSFWHDAVQAVQVFTHDNNVLLGTLLLDLYPRQGKYTHACQMTIIPTFKENNGGQHPGLAVVLANFPAPSGEKPALLKLADVRTFFHEFGHALHALLGATSVISLSGTNTKTDFVELPSQLLEEWLWDKDILKRVSSHYKTQQPFSDDLIERIVSLKHFSTGYFVQRQAYLAKLSLAYYSTLDDGFDLYQTMEQLYKNIITHVEYSDDTHFYASFGHLYGYGAKYYSYLWSNVFAQDVFSFIKNHGLTDDAVGQKYINCILKPGGTQNPTDMLVAFLGRKPNSTAFFSAMGLK